MIEKRKYEYSGLSFFCDDGEFLSFPRKRKISDVQLFAGLGIDWLRVVSFLRDYRLIKSSYNIPQEALIKYNMKDDKVTAWFTDNCSMDIYQKFFESSVAPFRHDVLTLLLDYGCFVIGCARKSVIKEDKPANTKKIKIEAFENLIQRIAYLSFHNLRGTCLPKIRIIAETPSSDVQKTLPECYRKLYLDGRGTSGNTITVRGRGSATSLNELKFDDRLIMNSTLEEPMLEIADIIAGMIRDFLDYCFYDLREAGKRIKRFFPLLGNLFHTDTSYSGKKEFPHQNETISVGLQLSPKSLYSLLDKKYSEILD